MESVQIKNRYILYLDDSGTNDNPCYLGGYIIKNGDQETEFQLDLKNIKKELLGNEDAYIKWVPTKRECPEQYSLTPQKRKELKTGVLNLIKKYNAVILCSVIRKDRDYWSSQCFALTRLMERFLFFLSSEVGFSATKQGYYPYGQVIIDYLGPKSKANLARVYSDYWKKGYEYSDDFEDIYIEGKDWKKVELRHCLRETLFYTHAKYCELLQVADFITGLMHDYFNSKAGSKEYFDIIKESVRKDKYGNVNGYGIIFVPKDLQEEHKNRL